MLKCETKYKKLVNAHAEKALDVAKKEKKDGEYEVIKGMIKMDRKREPLLPPFCHFYFSMSLGDKS